MFKPHRDQFFLPEGTPKFWSIGSITYFRYPKYTQKNVIISVSRVVSGSTPHLYHLPIYRDSLSQLPPTAVGRASVDFFEPWGFPNFI